MCTYNELEVSKSTVEFEFQDPNEIVFHEQFESKRSKINLQGIKIFHRCNFIGDFKMKLTEDILFVISSDKLRIVY